MEREIAEILAAASPEVGKWAAFWFGFWGALPCLLMVLFLAWGIRTLWREGTKED